jgi:hypothetical protein
MCLIAKGKKSIRAKEEMTVYKLGKALKNEFVSYSMYFSYKYNSLYKTKITVCSQRQPVSFADGVDSEHYRKNKVVSEIHPMTGHKIINKKYWQTVEGFHFFLTSERAKSYFRTRTLSLVECKIPKGAFVRFDETGLGISNQIIITKRKVKVKE